MSPAQVRAIAQELTALRGAKVVTLHQDTPSRFRMVLEHHRKRQDLVLDIDRAWPRIHLTAHRRAPARPTPLASGLRRQVGSARLDGALAVRGERAIAIALVRGGKPWTLWFEAFGRGANLYLVDAGGIVCLTPRGEVARRRGAAVGDRFTAKRPRNHDEGEAPGPEPASAAVAAQAEADRAEREDAARQRALLRVLGRARKKAHGAVRGLEAAREGEEEAERLGHAARLLQANFHLLRPGASEVTVLDHERDPPAPLRLPLEPRLPPGQQIGRLFEQARKKTRGGAVAAERLPAARRRLAALDALLAGAEGPLEDLERGAAALGVLPRAAGPRRSVPEPARAWRTFLSADGWRILVGRDARGNDRLTLHQSRPGDLWLHVRGAAGSHVVVPTPQGQTVPLPTLLDAAELAVFFSERRGSRAPAVEVDHVERRHVRKPRGSRPGAVVLDHARTLRLQPDETRRARLLTTGPRPA